MSITPFTVHIENETEVTVTSDTQAKLDHIRGHLERDGFEVTPQTGKVLVVGHWSNVFQSLHSIG